MGKEYLLALLHYADIEHLQREYRANAEGVVVPVSEACRYHSKCCKSEYKTHDCYDEVSPETQFVLAVDGGVDHGGCRQQYSHPERESGDVIDYQRTLEEYGCQEEGVCRQQFLTAHADGENEHLDSHSACHQPVCTVPSVCVQAQLENAYHCCACTQ